MSTITGTTGGLEAVQARLSELAALTGSSRPSFAAVLDAAAPNGRGVRIWDEVGSGSGTAAGTGTTAGTGTGTSTVADRPASWPPGGTTGTTGTTGTSGGPAVGGTTGTGGPTTYGALPAAGAQWMPLITETAAAHGLDPALLAALVWTESGFQADAVSPAGATGLAQLMPATAQSLGVDPTDPAQNLDGGARLLVQLLDRYDGDLTLALAAYNAGPGRVDAAGGVPAIAETQRFVTVVQDRRDLLAASAVAATTPAPPAAPPAPPADGATTPAPDTGSPSTQTSSTQASSSSAVDPAATAAVATTGGSSS